MKANNVVEENSGEFGCCGCFVAGNEVSHLGEAIHNYENRIIPFRYGKICNEIAGNAFPRSGWSGERSKFAILEMSGYFGARAYVTSGNILLNVGPDIREIIITQQ